VLTTELLEAFLQTFGDVVSDPERDDEHFTHAGSA
jgi:hypothetical protein